MTRDLARGGRIGALSLAAVLSAVGTGLLVGPAHAAPIPTSSTSESSAGRSAGNDGSGQDETSRVPQATDPAEQGAVSALWRALLEKIGLSGDEKSDEDSSDEGSSDEEDPAVQDPAENATEDDTVSGSDEATVQDEATDGDEAGDRVASEGSNPFAAAAPYGDPDYAAEAIEELRDSDPDAAAALERIAEGGVALWVGDWTNDVTATVRDYTSAAKDAGRTAVVVTYAVPGRDCGSYSAGGLSPAEYGPWVEQVADGLRGTGAAVIVEPDALAQAGECGGQGDRFALLREAVQVLDEAGASVYLDAGNSGWTGGQVGAIAERLRKAGVEQARGFATNVSNFNTDAAERAYGEALSEELDGAHYVVDSSRNGSGGTGEWCNPEGRTLGKAPAAVEDGSHQDARLWIKRAGESDGTCNGGPAAGTLWVEQAVELAQSS